MLISAVYMSTEKRKVELGGGGLFGVEHFHTCNLFQQLVIDADARNVRLTCVWAVGLTDHDKHINYIYTSSLP